MGIALFLLVSLFPLSPSAQDPPTNHCQDPASWADWDTRVAQHPTDAELQTLHALWLGLCVKVERGDMALEEATTIFEKVRGTLVRNRLEERQDKAEPSAL